MFNKRFSDGLRRSLRSLARRRENATSLGSLSSGSALQIANGDQVPVPDSADVGDAQAHEGLRLTGSEDKLDFKSIGRMNIDNRAEIAATKTVLGKISIQDDSVEQVKHDYPG